MEISPVKNRAFKYAGVYLTIILVLAAFGLGVLSGQTIFVKRQITNDEGSVEITKVVNLNRSLNKSDSVNFNQFWEVWDKVKTRYVKQPIKDADLFYGSIAGMVYGLGDPYSVYFPPLAAGEFAKSLSGEFSGIGAEVGVKNNQLVIVSPLSGSPAQKAGLRPADKILAIDKRPTIGMDVTTAVEAIRGPSTSSVTLIISRVGWEKPKDITIHRAKINIPAIMFSYKGSGVAYLRVMQFNENTMPALNKYINQMNLSDLKGVILDLRNNPGGYLETAVEMASEWIKDGAIVSEKFNGGKTNIHQTDGKHRFNGIKTVALINNGSASAAEIVAGALQDHRVATIIGEKSFGKGSVQDFETLSDGSALKITVAEWLTPNGNNINEKGITPDLEVKEDYEKEEVGQDAMIDKALEIISGRTVASQ